MRNIVGWVTAIVVAAALGVAAGRISARAAQRSAVSNPDAASWAAAWNSHNIDTVLGILARDVQIDQPENPKPLDYEGARGFFTMIFRGISIIPAPWSFSDADHKIKHISIYWDQLTVDHQLGIAPR
jgi:hypothetical protein